MTKLSYREVEEMFGSRQTVLDLLDGGWLSGDADKPESIGFDVLEVRGAWEKMLKGDYPIVPRAVREARKLKEEQRRAFDQWNGKAPERLPTLKKRLDE